MRAHSTQVLALVLSTAWLLRGQQAPPESLATFQSQSDLVLVPFNVERDSHFVIDLQQDDVELVQDGKPRAFTVFESPRTRGRTPVELILLFDTTTFTEAESKSPANHSRWNREAAYRWVSRWTDDESSALLERQAADVRVSVYRFDHKQLQRLCHRTSDPQALTAAIRRLPEQIPPEEAIPLTLPPGRKSFEDFMAKQGSKLDPKHPLILGTPSWSLEAIIGVLQDLAAAPEKEKAIRLLVDFSDYAGPTGTTPEDVAAQDAALAIPIYPVVMDYYPDNRKPVSGEAPPRDHPLQGLQPAAGLACDPKTLPIGYTCQAPSGPLWPGILSELTGGRAFYRQGIDEQVVSNLLEVVRNEGLLRYVVGFMPRPSERPRKHTLEIKLKSKTTGKLIGGERTAVY
jgi:hypothetical protein